MWSPTKILVPTDLSHDASHAINYASMMAKPFGSDITLCHVITLLEDAQGIPDRRFKKIEKINAALEKLTTDDMKKSHKRYKHINFNDVEIRGVSPVEEIVAYAGKNSYDLIVMETDDFSGLSHIVQRSVVEGVVQHATCPVLTIHHNGEHKIHYEINKIVVPIDFSIYSNQALNYGVMLARKYGAELQFLHVNEGTIPPLLITEEEMPSVAGVVPSWHNRSIAALREFVANAGLLGIANTFHIRKGKVHDEIINFADEQNADLIVISTHGRGERNRAEIGSTTEKIVKRAHVPVLAVVGKA